MSMIFEGLLLVARDCMQIATSLAKYMYPYTPTKQSMQDYLNGYYSNSICEGELRWRWIWIGRKMQSMCVVIARK